MSFQGSDSFYRGVELTVNAHGSQAVADLAAEVLSLDAKIAALSAQLRAGTVSTIEAEKEFTKLAGELARAEEAAAAGQRVLAGLSAKLDATGYSAKGATRAVLEFSRGMEDFTTGGFLGALNNIPGVFGGIASAAKLTAPQVAAVETAASLLGTAAYALYLNWGKVKKLLDDGLGPKLIEDIRSVTAELKELTEKEWKTRVDVQDIDNAKAKLDELQKQKRAFDAMNAPTDDEKGRGQAVIDAVTNAAGPGGGGRAAVVRGAIAASNLGDSPEVAETRKKMAEVDAQLAEAERTNDILAAGVHRVERDRLADSKEGRQAVEMQNRRAAIEQQVGAAGAGDEKARAWLQDLFEKNQGKFKASGVDVETFGPALAEASPAARKYAAEVDARYDHAIEETDRSIKDVKRYFDDLRKGEKTRTGQAVSGIGPGVDDDLQKRLYDQLKAGATAEAAKGAQRAGLVGTLKARGVGDDIIDRVADEILRKAADTAQNLVNEGGRPKVDVKAVREAVQKVGAGYVDEDEAAFYKAAKGGANLDQAAAAMKPNLVAALKDRGVADGIVGDVADELLGRARERALNLIENGGTPKLDQAKTKAVNDQVHRVKPAFDDDLEQTLLRRIAGGEDRNRAAADLNAQLQRRLGARGVPAELQDDVSHEIMRQVANHVANQLATATNPRQAAAGAVVQGEATNANKFAHEFKTRGGANDQQAAYAGKLTAGLVDQGVDAQSAMQAVYNAMTGHLENVSGALQRMIADQQRLLMMIDSANQGLGAVRTSQNQLGTKINMIAQFNSRPATRGITRSNTGGGGLA